MRQNPIAYTMFVDRFASSIIGNKNWGYEGDNPVQGVVTGTTGFNDVITVSDEAFMLVCMESYRERWLAEAKQKDALVHTQTTTAAVLSLSMLLMLLNIQNSPIG